MHLRSRPAGPIDDSRTKRVKTRGAEEAASLSEFEDDDSEPFFFEAPPVVLYRGLSVPDSNNFEEHLRDGAGMHWTTDLDTAKQFGNIVLEAEANPNLSLEEANLYTTLGGESEEWPCERCNSPAAQHSGMGNTPVCSFCGLSSDLDLTADEQQHFDSCKHTEEPTHHEYIEANAYPQAFPEMWQASDEYKESEQPVRPGSPVNVKAVHIQSKDGWERRDYRRQMTAAKCQRQMTASGKPQAIICDLDGTLASVDHRRHLVDDTCKSCMPDDDFYKQTEPNKDCPTCSGTGIDPELTKKKRENWEAFHELSSLDSPVPEVVDILRGAYNKGQNIVFSTGRPDIYRYQTQWWLAENLPWLDEYELMMRKSMPHRKCQGTGCDRCERGFVADQRPDDVVKEEMYHESIEPNFDVQFALDDRPSVIAKWKELGLPVIERQDPKIPPLVKTASPMSKDLYQQLLKTHPYLYHNPTPGTPPYDLESPNTPHEIANAILRKGLIPQYGGESNWLDNLKSRKEFVYLSSEQGTNNYDGHPLIRVDVSKLDPNNLFADEDFLVDSYDDSKWNNKKYNWNKFNYIKELENQDNKLELAFNSLTQNGTCSHRGIIPPEALSWNPAFKKLDVTPKDCEGNTVCYGYKEGCTTCEVNPKNPFALPKEQKTAAWADVRNKARRIRRSKGVEIVRLDDDVIVAKVRGDHATYEVEIFRQYPNSKSVTYWTCSCLWGEYAFKRQVTYVGRFCSHALATLYEAHSQEYRKKPVTAKSKYVYHVTLGENRDSIREKGLIEGEWAGSSWPNEWYEQYLSQNKKYPMSWQNSNEADVWEINTDGINYDEDGTVKFPIAPEYMRLFKTYTKDGDNDKEHQVEVEPRPVTAATYDNKDWDSWEIPGYTYQRGNNWNGWSPSYTPAPKKTYEFDPVVDERIGKTLEKLTSDYPITKNFFRGHQYGDLDLKRGGAFGCILGDGTIYMNKNEVFNPHSLLLDPWVSQMQVKDKKRWSVGEGLEQLTAHEFAHILHMSITKDAMGELPHWDLNNMLDDTYLPIVRPMVNHEDNPIHRITQEAKANNPTAFISQYAQRDELEHFAETMLDYWTSPDPEPYSREVGTKVDDLYHRSAGKTAARMRGIVFNGRRGSVFLDVEVADTPSAIQTGLMYRSFLPMNQGMLFDFKRPTTNGFWMQNVSIPLSIAFVDNMNRIIDIQDMSLCFGGMCPSYAPNKPYTMAIEVNQGWFQYNGVGVGDFITLT